MAQLSNRSHIPPDSDGEPSQPEVVRMLWARYADSLYDLSLRLLYDQDAASEVVRRTFDSLGTPNRSPDLSLRASLLTKARRIALDQLQMRADLRNARQRNVERPPWTEAIDKSRLKQGQPLETAVALAGDIWIAATTLAPSDYSLIDLFARKDIDIPTIGAATMQPETTLTVILERVGADLKRATADQLLLRFGPTECASLKTELGRRPAAVLSPELQSRISGHIRACARCRSAWRDYGAAADFYPALANLSLPGSEKERVIGAAFGPAPSTAQTPSTPPIIATVGSFDDAPTEFVPQAPRTLLNVEPRRDVFGNRVQRRNRGLQVAMLTPVVVIVLAAGAWFAYQTWAGTGSASTEVEQPRATVTATATALVEAPAVSAATPTPEGGNEGGIDPTPTSEPSATATPTAISVAQIPAPQATAVAAAPTTAVQSSQPVATATQTSAALPQTLPPGRTITEPQNITPTPTPTRTATQVAPTPTVAATVLVGSGQPPRTATPQPTPTTTTLRTTVPLPTTAPPPMATTTAPQPGVQPVTSEGQHPLSTVPTATPPPLIPGRVIPSGPSQGQSVNPLPTQSPLVGVSTP